VIVARAPVSVAVLADLGVQPDQVKSQTGTGWSFTIQGPSESDKALVMVYLSDESEAEAVALRLRPGTISSRAEVPPVVLIKDMGMQPGGTKVMVL
jgi:hypothetical protein